MGVTTRRLPLELSSGQYLGEVGRRRPYYWGMASLQASAYSTKEAGRLLGVSDEAIRRRIESGTLPGDKTGSRWWASRDAVEEERSVLLSKLQAVDARMGIASSISDRERTLRAEVGRLRTSLASMILAAEAFHDVNRGHLDALRQAIMPDYLESQHGNSSQG